MPNKEAYDDTKTAELLLYVASQVEDDETSGQTKLHKILYFADRAHLVQHGTTITDADYRKAPQGPTIRRMLPILRELESAEAAKVVERIYYGNKQKRLVALRDPDLSLFSADEIADVDRAIRQLWGKTATETSRISHEDPGWIAASEGGEIHMPLSLVAEEPEITDRMRERARELADCHG